MFYPANNLSIELDLSIIVHLEVLVASHAKTGLYKVISTKMKRLWHFYMINVMQTEVSKWPENSIIFCRYSAKHESDLQSTHLFCRP